MAAGTPFILSVLQVRGENHNLRRLASRIVLVLLFTVAMTGVGLQTSHSLNLGPVFLQARLSNALNVGDFMHVIWLSAACGAALSILLALIDALVFQKRLPPEAFQAEATIPLWIRTLAAVYASIIEEFTMRLFLLSTVVLVFSKVLGSFQVGLNACFLLSNTIVALVFALGHLPSTPIVLRQSVVGVVRTISLNALGGFVFGALYLRYGLESAVVAHLSAGLTLAAISAL